MAKNKNYTLMYRRKRTGKTDYRARLRLLLSRKNRLVVRKSNYKIYLQIINYGKNGDKTLLAIDSGSLTKYGWRYKLNNLPACYLTGLLIGVNAKKQKINEAIFDTGLNVSVKGSVFYAALKGMIDAGLIIQHNNKILPSEDRIKGKHIHDYALSLKKQPEHYKRQFSSYLNKDANPEDIIKNFDEVKQKILEEK